MKRKVLFIGESDILGSSNFKGVCSKYTDMIKVVFTDSISTPEELAYLIREEVPTEEFDKFSAVFVCKGVFGPSKDFDCIVQMTECLEILEKNIQIFVHHPDSGDFSELIKFINKKKQRLALASK